MSRVLASGLCAFFVVALCAACPAAASPNADRQRVAIVERTNFSGNGTFELIPLSSGPLKHDAGRVTGFGTHSAPTLRNGQRTVRAAGTDTLKGKLGKFGLAWQI